MAADVVCWFNLLLKQERFALRYAIDVILF